MVENPRVSHVQLADITKKSKEAIRINIILKQSVLIMMWQHQL